LGLSGPGQCGVSGRVHFTQLIMRQRFGVAPDLIRVKVIVAVVNVVDEFPASGQLRRVEPALVGFQKPVRGEAAWLDTERKVDIIHFIGLERRLRGGGGSRRDRGRGAKPYLAEEFSPPRRRWPGEIATFRGLLCVFRIRTVNRPLTCRHFYLSIILHRLPLVMAMRWFRLTEAPLVVS